MAKVTVEDEVDRLADMRDELAGMMKALAEETTAVCRPVAAKLEAVQKRYADKIKAATKLAKQQEDRVKSLVLKVKDRVLTDRLDCRYAQGRVSWNDDQLTGYAASHPEIMPFRTVGEPSVAIYAVKKEKA